MATEKGHVTGWGGSIKKSALNAVKTGTFITDAADFCEFAPPSRKIICLLVTRNDIDVAETRLSNPKAVNGISFIHSLRPCNGKILMKETSCYGIECCRHEPSCPGWQDTGVSMAQVNVGAVSQESDGASEQEAMESETVMINDANIVPEPSTSAGVTSSVTVSAARKSGRKSTRSSSVATVSAAHKTRSSTEADSVTLQSRTKSCETSTSSVTVSKVSTSSVPVSKASSSSVPVSKASSSSVTVSKVSTSSVTVSKASSSSVTVSKASSSSVSAVCPGLKDSGVCVAEVNVSAVSQDSDGASEHEAMETETVMISDTNIVPEPSTSTSVNVSAVKASDGDNEHEALINDIVQETSDTHCSNAPSTTQDPQTKVKNVGVKFYGKKTNVKLPRAVRTLKEPDVSVEGASLVAKKGPCTTQETKQKYKKGSVIDFKIRKLECRGTICEYKEDWGEYLVKYHELDRHGRWVYPKDTPVLWIEERRIKGLAKE